MVVLFPNASDVRSRMTTSETDALALFAIGGGVAFTQLCAFSVENRKGIYRVVRTWIYHRWLGAVAGRLA